MRIWLLDFTIEIIRTLGERGETYDSIIRRLIQEAGMKNLDSRWNFILEKDEFIPLEDLICPGSSYQKHLINSSIHFSLRNNSVSGRG